MAFNYTGIAATATKTIAQFGKSVTLRSVSAGTYDPATGLNTTAPVDTTRKGVIFDFKPSQQRGPGGEVLGTDKTMMLEAGVIPKVQDLIIDGSDQYTIIGIDEINPAGTPLVYNLHLRK